jgi:hypothetical protein
MRRQKEADERMKLLNGRYSKHTNNSSSKKLKKNEPPSLISNSSRHLSTVELKNALSNGCIYYRPFEPSLIEGMLTF